MAVSLNLALRRSIRWLFIAALFWPLTVSQSFAHLATQTGNTEEAYFLFEEVGNISNIKDLFVIKVTNLIEIKRGRDMLAGTQPRSMPIGKLVKSPACYNPGWSYYLDEVRFGVYLEPTSFRYVEDFGGAVFDPDVVAVPATLIKELPKPDCAGNIAFHVSAASYKRSNLTREGLVSAFGSNMTTRTEAAASVPLPTTLGGVTITVEDSAGVKRLGRLLFVSPNQINYVMPLDTALGNATITIDDGQGRLTKGYEFIRQEGPGLFTANGNGRGVAAGFLLKVRHDGTQAYEPLFEFDATKQEFVPRTVGFERADEDYYLVLYGTGMRGYQQPEVYAYRGDNLGQIVYAGSQLGLAGLDQVNIRLAKEAAGSGLVQLGLQFRSANSLANTRWTNVVEVKIGGVRATN
jgi:uncharacterized protein (TIGR03437 family)